MRKQCISKRLGMIFLLTSFFLVSCDKNSTLGDTSREDSFLRAAEKFQNSGDLGASLSFYKQILEKEPENLEALLGAATVSWKMGDYAQTQQYLDKLLVQDPTSFSARRLRAKTFLAQEKAPEALALFQVLAKERPEDASLLNLQGVCYDLSSDHEKARTFYKKALLIEPKNMGILSNLGLSLTLSGQYDEAKKILEQVKDMAGITSRERHNLAIAYGLSGDLARAEHIFRIDLDAATTRMNIERLASMSGAAPGALPFVEHTATLAPEPESSAPTPMKPEEKIDKKVPHPSLKKSAPLKPSKKETLTDTKEKSKKEEILPKSGALKTASFVEAPSQDSLKNLESVSSFEEVISDVSQENSLTSDSILDR